MRRTAEYRRRLMGGEDTARLSHGVEGSVATRESRPLLVSGKYVSLAPPMREDVDNFYRWQTDLETLPFWSLRNRKIVSYEEFVAQLQRFLMEPDLTVMLIDNETGNPGGFARLYDMNWVDGWAWFGCLASPDYRSRAVAFSEAVVLFLAYTFDFFPLRKVYAEIAEYNTAALGIAKKLGFQAEGGLSDHVWFRDRFWDAEHFSLSRNAWQETLGRLRRLNWYELGLAQILRNGAGSA